MLKRYPKCRQHAEGTRSWTQATVPATAAYGGLTPLLLLPRLISEPTRRGAQFEFGIKPRRLRPSHQRHQLRPETLASKPSIPAQVRRTAAITRHGKPRPPRPPLQLSRQ